MGDLIHQKPSRRVSDEELELERLERLCRRDSRSESKERERRHTVAASERPKQQGNGDARSIRGSRETVLERILPPTGGGGRGGGGEYSRDNYSINRFSS